MMMAETGRGGLRLEVKDQVIAANVAPLLPKTL